MGVEFTPVKFILKASVYTRYALGMPIEFMHLLNSYTLFLYALSIV